MRANHNLYVDLKTKTLNVKRLTLRIMRRARALLFTLPRVKNHFRKEPEELTTFIRRNLCLKLGKT